MDSRHERNIFTELLNLSIADMGLVALKMAMDRLAEANEPLKHISTVASLGVAMTTTLIFVCVYQYGIEIGFFDAVRARLASKKLRKELSAVKDQAPAAMKDESLEDFAVTIDSAAENLGYAAYREQAVPEDIRRELQEMIRLLKMIREHVGERELKLTEVRRLKNIYIPSILKINDCYSDSLIIGNDSAKKIEKEYQSLLPNIRTMLCSIIDNITDAVAEDVQTESAALNYMMGTASKVMEKTH